VTDTAIVAVADCDRRCVAKDGHSKLSLRRCLQVLLQALGAIEPQLGDNYVTRVRIDGAGRLGGVGRPPSYQQFSAFVHVRGLVWLACSVHLEV